MYIYIFHYMYMTMAWNGHFSKNKPLSTTLLVAFFGLALCFVVTGAFLVPSRPPPSQPQPQPSHIQRQVYFSRALYPVFPYSVVSGGIHDKAALMRALRAGFLPAGFNVQNARFIRMPKDFCTYLTFRNDAGHVAWSTRKVCIRAGELAITDGHMTILARCANQIATKRPKDVLAADIPVDATIPVQDHPVTSLDSGLSSVLYPAIPTPTVTAGVPGVSVPSWPAFPVFPVSPIFPVVPVPTPFPVKVPSGDDAFPLACVSIIATWLAIRFHEKTFAVQCSRIASVQIRSCRRAALGSTRRCYYRWHSWKI